MTVSLDDHLKKFTPQRRARIEARTTALVEEELTLRDLRQAEHLTQERMAELMGVEQESISRLERRADLLLSTLSSYVAAMGGKLRLVAEFPDRRPRGNRACRHYRRSTSEARGSKRPPREGETLR